MKPNRQSEFEVGVSADYDERGKYLISVRAASSCLPTLLRCEDVYRLATDLLEAVRMANEKETVEQSAEQAHWDEMERAVLENDI